LKSSLDWTMEMAIVRSLAIGLSLFQVKVILVCFKD